MRSTRPTGGGAGSSNPVDHLSVWDLQTRTRIPVMALGGSTPPPSAGLGEFDANSEVADLVEVTNERALCAGSIPATGATIIDVVAFPTPTNTSALLLATYTLNGGGGFGPAGQTNDVAITPDGKIGVVNYANAVTFILMRTGAVLLRQDLTALGMPPGASSLVSPEGATDSIALTNDVAAIISTRDPGTTNSMPWIFLFSLSQGPVPVPFYASPFLNLPMNEPGISSVARSVRIPPDHRQVVMTADKLVACKKLSGGVATTFYPAVHRDDNEGRPYHDIRDSLEVTNTRVVALSKNSLNPAGPQGRITLFDMTNSGFLTIIGSPHELPPLTTPGSNIGHDLAISPDSTIAIIKGQQANYAVTTLDTAPQVGGAIPSNADPLVPALPGGAGGPFVSDSVVITADGSTAIMIGAHFNPSSLHFDGVAEFMQLTGSLSFSAVQSQPNKNLFAADLKPTRDGSKVLVRYKTSTPPLPNLPPGDPTGQDFVLYTFSGGVVAQFAGDGDTFRLDDIEVGGALHVTGGTGTAIGIGETTSGAPSPATGHVHLLWY